MRILSFIIVLILTVKVGAQTGPGGVGNNSSNLLWLKANEITLTAGSNIVTWSDNSGNSNGLTQPTASFQPTFQTGIINGLPVVRFAMNEGRLINTSFPIPNTAITTILVNSNVESTDGLISYSSTSSDNDFLIFNSSNLQVFRGSSTTSGVSINDGAFHITNVSWQNSDGAVNLWKDGSKAYNTTGFRTGTTITSGGTFALAHEQDGINASYDATQDHSGDFSEIMVFNTALNDAQQIIISNYLAAKYDLAISNDFFSYRATHSNNVAGIGREDASNIHTSATSDTILNISNASSLDTDNDYLLFGHDNGDVTTWTTNESPNGGNNIQRLAREWRLDETGNVGTIDFTIDIANFPSIPAGHNLYTVMVDTDGDFSSGAEVYELSLSAGTIYTSASIDINDGDFIALAAVRPVIDHSYLNSSGFEVANATIFAELNFIPSTNRTVNYSTANGTALAAQPDYTAIAGGLLTFPTGTSSITYTVNLTNDVIVESSETFTITFSSPTVGLNLGPNATHTFTINDDDDSRKIYFDLNNSSIVENTGSSTIAVSINNVDASNPTTVNYSVTSGTALGSGVDYTLAAGTLIIAAGSTTNNFSFTVNDDALFEGNETFTVTLSSPTNSNLDGVPPLGGTGFLEHVVTISENDPPPVIQFSTTSVSVTENNSTLSITVEQDVVSGIDASANYTLSGTATNGADYNLADGTVLILEGNTSATISFMLLDDLIEELNETAILTLTAPTAATLGANTVFTVNIADNDVFGCDGPGGVGDATNNVLWVRADEITPLTDGADVLTWNDQSGNNHNLTQTNSSFSPTYQSNIINSQPVVRFSKSNARIIHNSFTAFPTTEISTFLVNSNGDGGDGVYSYATTASNNEFLLFNSSSLTLYRQGPTSNSGTAINGNTFRIINATWRSSDGNYRLYRNGTQDHSGTVASGNSIISGGCLAIAGEQDAVNGGYDSNQAHQGDFAEVITYNVVLNTSRRKIVQNYLSAKYNLTIANDLYSYDAPGTHGFEVAGLGQDDGTNFHLAGKGSAILKIQNPTDLDNGEYLIWGHDNANLDFNDTDVPLMVDNRVNRVWRADETGSVGNVDMVFDMSDFTVTDGTQLVLLIDSDDGVFTNASITSITSYTGTEATFEGVNLNSGDWFTVATLTSSNTLPITLLSFDAKLVNELVELVWETATEVNNDYFTIERSMDAKNWSKLFTISGAGNSTSPKKYAAIDSEVLIGANYYRLTQTDYDGQSEIFKPVYVFYQKSSANILKVYPNPTKNTFQLQIKEPLFQPIIIRNNKGVKISVEITKTSELIYEVNLGSTASGLYLIQVGSEIVKVIKQ